jgi:hypothetical protein
MGAGPPSAIPNARKNFISSTSNHVVLQFVEISPRELENALMPDIRMNLAPNLSAAIVHPPMAERIVFGQDRVIDLEFAEKSIDSILINFSRVDLLVPPKLDAFYFNHPQEHIFFDEHETGSRSLHLKKSADHLHLMLGFALHGRIDIQFEIENGNTRHGGCDIFLRRLQIMFLHELDEGFQINSSPYVADCHDRFVELDAGKNIFRAEFHILVNEQKVRVGLLDEACRKPVARQIDFGRSNRSDIDVDILGATCFCQIENRSGISARDGMVGYRSSQENVSHGADRFVATCAMR